MDNHCVMCGSYLVDTSRMICPDCDQPAPIQDAINQAYMNGYKKGFADCKAKMKKAKPRKRKRHAITNETFLALEKIGKQTHNERK